jgi:hypothetical protein
MDRRYNLAMIHPEGKANWIAIIQSRGRTFHGLLKIYSFYSVRSSPLVWVNWTRRLIA